MPKSTLSLREVRMHLRALLANVKYAFNSLVLTVNWSANQPVNNLRTPVKKKNHTLKPIAPHKPFIAPYPQMRGRHKDRERL